MLPLLSECWRFAEYLLRPEDSLAMTAQRSPAASRAGIAKALFWAGLAVLAGLGLGQLHG